MAEKPATAFHVIVFGRVQGVGFRYSTIRAATKLGVVGWVRNRADGTVEVYCEGEPDQISRFLTWLAKGPPGSSVSRIEKKKVKSLQTYRSFIIEY